MADASYDPYALDADAVQPPPHSLARALRQIGPGLILAGSVVGTGELIATTNLGARVGFILLWLVILSCFVKVFVQVELGRHAVSSGQTTLRSFHEIPVVGWVLPWWWLFMMLTTLTQVGAMIGGVAQAFHMAMPYASPRLAEWIGHLHSGAGSYLHGRPEIVWALLTTAVTALLLVTGSYWVVERVSIVLVVMFTLMTVACVALLPGTGHSFGWPEIADGLSFQIPPDAVTEAFALIGLIGVGANELIAYPYWCIEKGYARKTGPRSESPDWQQRARGWLRVLRLDAWVSLLIYTVATLAFYALGAAILYIITSGKGVGSSVGDMMTELAQMYQPVLGERASLWFIVVGAFAVLYSTLVSATAGNGRMTTDFLQIKGVIRFSRPDQRRRWVGGCCVFFLTVGFILFIWIGNPRLMVTIGGLAQAVTLPMIAAAAVFLRFRRTDRRITPGRVWDAFLWISTLSLALAAAYGIWDAIQKIGSPRS